MTDARLFDRPIDGTDAAAAASWAVIDAMYSDALFGIAAIAKAAEHTLTARAGVERTPRERIAVPAGRRRDDVRPLADLLSVGGSVRSTSRHAAETGTFPRQAA
jgi:hypothetical protein